MADEAEKPKEPTAYERFKAQPVVRWKIRASGAEMEVDLSDIEPFTMGDKIRLEKETGKKFGGLHSADGAEDEARLLHFVLRQVKPDLTFEEIADIPTPLAQRVMLFAGDRTLEGVDRPTSARSISSPVPTDGDHESSIVSASTS